MNDDLGIRNRDPFFIESFLDLHSKISFDLIVISLFCFLIDCHAYAAVTEGCDRRYKRFIIADILMRFIVIVCDIFQNQRL